MSYSYYDQHFSFPLCRQNNGQRCPYPNPQTLNVSLHDKRDLADGINIMDSKIQRLLGGPNVIPWAFKSERGRQNGTAER